MTILSRGNEAVSVMASAARALYALGDGTRREIIERLAEKPRSATELAKGLNVTRPAVSQHLKILKEAGLVSDRPQGTSRIYHLDPDGLAQVRAWLDQRWARAFAAFAEFVEKDGSQ